MLLLLEPWLGSFEPAFLRISPSKIHLLLPAAGQVAPLWVPMPNRMLCLFVAFLARTLPHSSIKVYLSGIRALHIDQEFPDLLSDCLRLQRVVRGIKRCQGTPSSTRLPITDDLMLVIWQSLDLSLPDHQMFWAACSLGYFSFLRASEFTVPNLSTFSVSVHLSVHDIAVNSSVARIKGSKTDPFRKGCFVHIGLGRHPLCTVQAMMSYLASRGDAPGPLFLFTTGQPLTHTSLTDWLRWILASAWIPGNFSSHSFRIGAATVAASNGVPGHLIQTMGRWSSNAYQLYIRTPADSLAALSQRLASAPSAASGRPPFSPS